MLLAQGYGRLALGCRGVTCSSRLLGWRAPNQLLDLDRSPSPTTRTLHHCVLCRPLVDRGSDRKCLIIMYEPEPRESVCMCSVGVIRKDYGLINMYLPPPPGIRGMGQGEQVSGLLLFIAQISTSSWEFSQSGHISHAGGN